MVSLHSRWRHAAGVSISSGQRIVGTRVLREYDRQQRGPTYWNVIARLKHGVTINQRRMR